MHDKREKIQGIYIDLVNEDDAFDKLREVIGSNHSAQIITINPEMIVKAHNDENLKNLINSSDLIIPDGIGVKIALKLKKIKQDQIRGVDFAYKLLKYAQENNYTVGFLGAKEDILCLTINKIKNDMPKINIVYSRNGYFDDENEIINEIQKAAPNIILTALGFPKQEIINFKLKKILQKSILIGVGGSFDVWSGTVQEAPPVWRKLGLEWLYRTIKQPERFKRIFPTLPIFLFRSIIEVVGRESK